MHSVSIRSTPHVQQPLFALQHRLAPRFTRMTRPRCARLASSETFADARLIAAVGPALSFPKVHFAVRNLALALACTDRPRALLCLCRNCSEIDQYRRGGTRQDTRVKIYICNFLISFNLTTKDKKLSKYHFLSSIYNCCKNSLVAVHILGGRLRQSPLPPKIQ
jgi:hypothetical protein